LPPSRLQKVAAVPAKAPPVAMSPQLPLPQLLHLQKQSLLHLPPLPQRPPLLRLKLVQLLLLLLLMPLELLLKRRQGAAGPRGRGRMGWVRGWRVALLPHPDLEGAALPPLLLQRLLRQPQLLGGCCPLRGSLSPRQFRHHHG
jgi:hypothetical protein